MKLSTLSSTRLHNMHLPASQQKSQKTENSSHRQNGSWFYVVCKFAPFEKLMSLHVSLFSIMNWLDDHIIIFHVVPTIKPLLIPPDHLNNSRIDTFNNFVLVLLCLRCQTFVRSTNKCEMSSLLIELVLVRHHFIVI